MANPFYQASGNPGQGSEGLSSLIRGEFAAIEAGFDKVPQILTSGSFSTTLAQVGDHTFTLPSADGTLALTADIAAEAAARTAAVAAETTARIAAIAAIPTGGGGGSSVAAEVARATAAESLLAPKASPFFTGIPVVPTANLGTDTNQIASTSFVKAAIFAAGVGSGTGGGTGGIGVAAETARAQAAEALLAPKASPLFTGLPRAPNPAFGTNSTQIATTAFVASAVTSEANRAATAEANLLTMIHDLQQRVAALESR